MPYLVPLPAAPSFALKGMKGYQFAPLKNQDFDLYYLEVEKGHDTYIVSKKLTRIYYVLEGKGCFTIEKQKYDMEPGMLVEVPPNVEYTYSGTMKVFLISHPRWFKGNEEVTRSNPDVVSGLSMSSVLAEIRLRVKYHLNKISNGFLRLI